MHGIDVSWEVTPAMRQRGFFLDPLPYLLRIYNGKL
jgi:hypothetical protein